LQRGKPPLTPQLLYICGPYRASRIIDVKRNIRRAERAAEWAWEHDWVPICPHANSAFIDGLVPDDVILAGCLEIMRRCDAVLLVHGWQDSRGCREEVRIAEELGIPILPQVYHDNL
jgi:hypothetical protein